MAELALQVVVSPLLGVLFDKLSSLLLGKFGLLWGVQKDLENLSSTISTIRCVLQDAERKQSHHAATRDWLRKLKEAAYEADDIIDECETEAESQDSTGSCSTQVCRSFSYCFDFNRHKIAKRIKTVLEKFDEIAAERNKFHLSESVPESRTVEESLLNRETSSTLLEPCVYGRDVDKEKIVNFLSSNESSQQDLLVYSIVGIGGLGKTTLTQCVYNDTRIAQSFQARIWVCVSEDFSAQRLTKMIIESLPGGHDRKLESLDALQNRLKELLSGKKFLLVLDDVWNEDPGKWDKLKFPLKCGAKGSSIIVTTRLTNVAQVMGASHVHQLTLLSDEECWLLFKSRAFDGEETEISQLEIIGKDIVKKCGGVPLAAKALGGSLRFEREVNVWISIRNSNIWELKEDNQEGGILPSLRLSYNHLPSRLKQCFSYCSIFRKDHRIDISMLIQLWVANGLVESQGGMELEDVGLQIFNQLLLRSFFQEVEERTDSYGISYETCKMHDLMHDLACSVAGNECLAFDGGDGLSKIPKTIRHLLSSSDSRVQTKTLCNSHPFLRTLLIPYPLHNNYAMIFKNLKCLRALNLSNSYGVSYLSDSIGRLKHLRYLDLSYASLRSLPSSLCDLKNLQILKLRHCSHLKMLPRNMNSLVNLRHLDLWGCESLIRMPAGIGALIHLRTLGRFIVGPGNGQSIKQLQGLNHLGEYLEINGLEHVRDAAEAKEANLTAKRNLRRLRLSWSWSNMQENANSEEVLEALQPHQDLMYRLEIRRYGGSEFPSWIKNLVNLVEITLSGCSKCEVLPPLGHLPLLKEVVISGMGSLKCVNPEFYSTNSRQGFFPSLQSLEFWNMPNWEEWQALDGKQAFPCLKKLTLRDCPKLASVPFPILRAVQELEVKKCKKLMVTSLPRLRVLELCDFFSFQNLESLLESLSLEDCKFTSIPHQIDENLTSLKSLKIKYCDNLKSLSQSLQHMSSLETLKFSNCSELEFSTGDFQHLLSLKTLKLRSLPKLTSLPDLHHLPTLQTLDIMFCKNLLVLPQWLQNLTCLHTLNIEYCHPDLDVQCKKDEGDYWPYISHIPDVRIRN